MPNLVGILLFEVPHLLCHLFSCNMHKISWENVKVEKFYLGALHYIMT
jgi:hypothetical protein